MRRRPVTPDPDTRAAAIIATAQRSYRAGQTRDAAVTTAALTHHVDRAGTAAICAAAHAWRRA